MFNFRDRKAKQQAIHTMTEREKWQEHKTIKQSFQEKISEMIQRDSRDINATEVMKFKEWLKNIDKKHTEKYLSERVAKRNIQKAHSRERMSSNTLSLSLTHTRTQTETSEQGKKEQNIQVKIDLTKINKT